MCLRCAKVLQMYNRLPSRGLYKHTELMSDSHVMHVCVSQSHVSFLTYCIRSR